MPGSAGSDLFDLLGFFIVCRFGCLSADLGVLRAGFAVSSAGFQQKKGTKINKMKRKL